MGGIKSGRATSNAAKIAAGTARPATMWQETRLRPSKPRMPAFVRKNKDAVRVWNEVVPELAEANLLARADAKTFGAWCLLQAKLETAMPGKIGLNTSEMAHWRMMACEFGLTPASRLRTPPLVKDPVPGALPEGECEKPQDFTGNVVAISRGLSNTPAQSRRAKSTSAATSALPAEDK